MASGGPAMGGYSGHSVMMMPPAGDAAQPPYDLRALPGPGDLFAADAVSGPRAASELEFLPQGLLYRSYLAGEKEPRVSSAWLSEIDRGMVWDVTLGGRAGLFRYGDFDGGEIRGIQFDVEGAAMVRLDPEENTDVEAADYRFGFLTTWRDGPWSAKAGYYHVSSHLGDEFLLRNPFHVRHNYVRDSAVCAISYDLAPALRLYAESAYAVGHEGGALPWEFQYGAEYSPLDCSTWGRPFAGVNGHTREDEGWITGVNVVSGWQWRGEQTHHRFRLGLQYYHGPALQYSFVGQTETLLGGGLWFDY
jgi:hypothetical protein